jgi:hypothetical protein
MGLSACWARPAAPGEATIGDAAERPAEIDAVTVHPVHARPFVCLEHGDGQFRRLGDALGTDCLIPAFAGGAAGVLPVFYRGEGRDNADFIGWDAEVLAPITGVVESVRVNPVVNRPGVYGRGRASAVVVRRADGVRVAVGHVQGVVVRVGDRVRAGQVLAHVGNNGYGRMPHTHLGAWRGREPLQIRFDQRAVPAPTASAGSPGGIAPP